MGSEPIPLPYKSWQEVSPELLKRDIANNQPRAIHQLNSNARTATIYGTTHTTGAPAQRGNSRTKRLLVSIVTFLTSLPVILVIKLITVGAEESRQPTLPTFPPITLSPDIPKSYPPEYLSNSSINIDQNADLFVFLFAICFLVASQVIRN